MTAVTVYEFVGGPKDGEILAFECPRQEIRVIRPMPRNVVGAPEDEARPQQPLLGLYVAGWFGDPNSDRPRSRVMVWRGEL